MKKQLISVTLAAARLALLCATPVSLRAATLTVASTADSGAGTLRAALASATNGDTINFSVTGTIALTSGQLTVSRSVTILGPGASALTVSGNNASRVFNVTAANVTISGLTVADGQSALSGAGICAAGSPGSVLTVSRCMITNNISTTLNGGGIYNNPGVTLAVSSCNIRANQAANGAGGGIYNDHGSLSVVDSTLGGNFSGFPNTGGGGIFNNGSSGSATLTIATSTLSDNTAMGGGGGIYNDGYYGNATLTINGSTFSDNASFSGIAGGGGIYNAGFAGWATLMINASTFSENQAGAGGDVCLEPAEYSSVTLEVGDTIFNGSAGGSISSESGTVTSDGYNLSSDDGGGFLTATGDQINTDPKLGPLQNNGGPTWTHALLPGSPAIDQGKRDAVPGLALNIDQRGFQRPVDNPHLANATGGDGSDIGAFEQLFIIAVTNTADSGPGSLRAVLAGSSGGATVDASGITGTITLTSGQLNVSNSLTILGPGPGALTVSGNNASRVFNVTGTNVTISGLTIGNGSTSLSGAGINAGGGPGSVLIVSGCAMTSNTATLNGGGIYITSGVAMTVSNCTISGNRAASGGGGGIGNQNGTLTVVASTLSGNSGGVGGGIDNDGGSGGNATLTVNASTFSSNSAYIGGGGILNWGESGSATLTVNASTFSGNSAGGSGGGGIYNNNDAGTGRVDMSDTILSAGSAGANIYNYSGPFKSDGYNLSSDDGGGLLTASGDQVNTDPKLGPLQNNGGPTMTHALLPGSPAIDQGKRDAIPALALNTDQRGFQRPVDNSNLANAAGGDGSDIGAFEVRYSIVTNSADSGPGTLRTALATAGNVDMIDASGITGTITLTSGRLNVSNNLTILGPGPGALTVSGNNASGVFNVTGTNVTISGLTIAKGSTSLSGAGLNAGGSPGSVVTINNCVVTGNSAMSGGGGIFNEAGVLMTVSNCTICGNSAVNEAGGGILNFSGGALTIIDSTLSGNSSLVAGGGIYNYGGTLSLIGSTLSSNSAAYGGGGIYNDGYAGSATMTINASTLNNNSAGSGGGIYNYGDSGSATLTINGSTLSGNSSAGGYGGGIYTEGHLGNAALTINASTFSGNSLAVVGGSVFNAFGTVVIGDTILNDSSAGGNIYNISGPVTSDGYNLSSDDGSGFLTNTTDQVNADPRLGPLQNNGGPTWTQALLAGSPAIDKGKTNAVPGLAYATDQRGLLRLVDNPYLANATGGDGSDIGAFEVQGSGGYDTDGDGLPDFWELAWFGNLNQTATGDFDGTGQNNLFKYLAGLNPAEPTSVFTLRIAMAAGRPNQRNLIFKPWAAGRTYTAQFTTNLATTAFSALTGFGGPTTNGAEVTFTDLNATGQQRFYRIRISLP